MIAPRDPGPIHPAERFGSAPNNVLRVVAPSPESSLVSSAAAAAESAPDAAAGKPDGAGDHVSFGIPPAYAGHFDIINNGVAEGWAVSCIEPGRRVRVELWAGNVFLALGFADQFRADLLRAGFGDGRHAFRIPIPAALHWAAFGEVSARVAGEDHVLQGTPRTEAPLAASLSATSRAHVMGCIEAITEHGISGWALRGGQDAPLRLTLVVDGEQVAAFSCDRAREDVWQARPELHQYRGNPDNLGFLVPIPPACFDDQTHSFSLTTEAGEALTLPTVGKAAGQPYAFRFDAIEVAGRVEPDGDQNVIHGWAVAMERSTGRKRVANTIVITSTTGQLVRIVADLPRPDVAAALGCDDQCGFRFEPGPEMAGGSLRFLVLPEGVELPCRPVARAAAPSAALPPPHPVGSRAVAVQTAAEPPPQRAAARRQMVFTIVSANYISFAATLMHSVARHLPHVERYIVLSDAMQTFPDLDLGAELLSCDQIGIDHVENMKVWYTVIEFNTAVKPFAFLHFFKTLGFDSGCYIDPDILLFSGMPEVFDALETHSCVLTPHITSPLQDGKQPSEHTIMKSGVYNLGFLGLRNDEDGIRLAQWWADRLFLHCRVDIPGNMFTDQRWMDLAPVLVRRPCILRHFGYNVAYWNLPHRQVERAADGSWLVNGERLVFFHFSGVSPVKPEEFSKHQDRYGRDNLGIVNELCDMYRKLVIDNHWARTSKIPYAFGKFADGARIEDLMRHWVIRMIDAERLDPRGRLNFTAGYFDRPDEIAGEQGALLTRYMYQLWLNRKDLRDAFDIYNAHGLQGYYDWFIGGDAALQGATPRTLAAAARLRAGGAPAAERPPALREPPWPPVANMAPAGSGAEALQRFAGDIRFTLGGGPASLPRQFALLWERRIDLQQAFDVSKAEQLEKFMCWCLTDASAEGCVDFDLLPADMLQRFSQAGPISAHYGDVPVTEMMITLRQVAAGRDMLPGWQRFPVERVGRVAHGLWFTFVAPKRFRWPNALVASLREYFHRPSAIAVDGFRINMGTLSLWELRPDLQQTFPLGSSQSGWQFLRWLLVDGLRELGCTIDEFDPRLRGFLLSHSPRHAGVSQLLEMLHDLRPNLATTFDLRQPEELEAFLAWSDQHLAEATAGLSLAEALQRPVGAWRDTPPVHRARVGLAGFWTAATGRAEDLRCSARALTDVGMQDYVVIDLETQAVLLPDGTRLADGTRLEVEINIMHTNAETSFEDARLLKRMGVRAGRSIGLWAWELEWLPDYWRHAFLFYDEVWAATRFAQGAFERDRLRPVSLVPMAVIEPDIGVTLTRADLAVPEAATLFLFMFDFRSFASRKNPEAVVKAFLAAFPDGSEPAHLLIKTSGAEAKPADWDALLALADDPRIEIRDARLERDELLNLVRMSDAFVSLHRSEGFGRGPAESMLLGVPVIVTDYSGTADYAAPDCALVVDYELVKVEPGEYPGAVGQRWADANVATAARHMRWVHENPDAAKALGLRGQQRIRELYDTHTVGEAMMRALGLAREGAAEPAGASEPLVMPA